jgi:hypothetical protein
MSPSIRIQHLAAATALMAAPLPAQQNEAFVLLHASGDTVAVERFTRNSERLAGELLVRAAGARFTWAATLAPDATVTRLENAFRVAGADRAAAPAQSALITFPGDSAIAVITTGDRTVTQRVASQRGAIPFINPSFALVEQVVRRAFVLGGDSVNVPTFLVQGGRTLPFIVRRVGPDSVTVDLGGAPARLAVNAAGDLLGGTVPAQGLRVIRARDLR